MGGQFLLLLLCSSFLLAVSCVWLPEKVLMSAGQYRERGKAFTSYYDLMTAETVSDEKTKVRRSRVRRNGAETSTQRSPKGKGAYEKPTIGNQQELHWGKPQKTTVPPITQDPSLSCFPYDSCASRCGENQTGPTIGYVCNCDQLCEIYRDCCADYRHFCIKKVRISSDGNTDEPPGDNVFVDIFIPHGKFPAKTTTTNAPTTTTAVTTPSPRSVQPLERNEFECVTIDEYPQATIWAQTSCDPNWQRNDIASRCQATRGEGILSKLPVQGTDGFTYRNLYCAQCNKVPDIAAYWISVSACFTSPPNDVLTDPDSLAQYLNKDCTTVFQIPEEALYRPRKCVPSVDTCIRQEAYDLKYLQWMKGCYEGYQSLVLGQILKSGTYVYKNLNCALCNGVDTERVQCAYPRFQLEELLPEDVLQSGEEFGLFPKPSLKGASDSERISLIPYAVITNYNEEGDESTFIVDTQSGNVIPVPQNCDEGMVFDPYLGECRQVYCAEGFILVDNECVFEVPPLPTSHDYEGRKNRTMDDQITISISISLSIVLGSEATPSPEIKDDLIDLIANWLNVTEWNYTKPEEPISLNVSFWTVAEANLTSNGLNFLKFTLIMDNLNSTIHNISNVFGELVRFNVMNVQVIIDGVPIKVDWNDFERFVDALRGNLIPLKLFFTVCKSGNATMYLSDEVTFKEGGDCPLMYVEEIDREYNCREMLLLNYDPEIDINHQNFSMITCEGMPTLDASCVRIRLNGSEYTLLNNGSIVIISSGEMFHPKDYLILGGDTVEICTDYTPFIKNVFVVQFLFSQTQWIY